jgi:hypothetical protein
MKNFLLTGKSLCFSEEVCSMDLEIWLLRQASMIYGTVFEDFVHFYVNTQPQNFMYFFSPAHTAQSLFFEYV